MQLNSASSKRILTFGDNLPISLPSTPFLSEHRIHAASLHNSTPARPPSSPSSSRHLSRTPITVLDAFQPATTVHASPLAWSSQDVIAVICRNKAYLSDRATTAVFDLPPTGAESLEFTSAHGDTLAVALSLGIVQHWDIHTRQGLRSWAPDSSQPRHTVGALAYDPTLSVLAIARAGGHITVHDPRAPHPAASHGGRWASPKNLTTSLKWSADGRLLASGDARGGLQIWDVRAGACMMKCKRTGHRAMVKALTWCPWQTELLASGGLQPDGTIKLWNTKRLCGEPLSTLQLNTAVTSLHWSAHCRELLSTHGVSWEVSGDRHTPAVTRYTNSVTVHRLKGALLERVVGVERAHLAPISTSAIGPDGKFAFTLCVREGIMKMWSVWGEKEKPRERESVLDVERCIR